MEIQCDLMQTLPFANNPAVMTLSSAEPPLCGLAEQVDAGLCNCFVPSFLCDLREVTFLLRLGLACCKLEAWRRPLSLGSSDLFMDGLCVAYYCLYCEFW